MIGRPARGFGALFVAAAVLCAGAGSAAVPGNECPLPADAPYSAEMPIYDILADPPARAAVESAAPGLLARVPGMMRATTLPSLSAILSLRFVAAIGLIPADRLDAVDTALGKVTPSPEGLRARCERYDMIAPRLPSPRRPALLIFEKSSGYSDKPAVAAANAMVRSIAQRRGWDTVSTANGAAINATELRRYAAVIWNNVSGDVLTVSQRAALRRYVERGGGFVALHGSGGDPYYYWDWYADRLIGARFIGHTGSPQIQPARIIVEDQASAITRGLGTGWTMNDEWYSFRTSPRATGAHVLLRLDEASYDPRMGRTDLRMGDHPIAWTRCVRNGRAFYSGIGHRPESYSEPNTVRLIEQALSWTAGRGETRCRGGREERRRVM